MFHHHRELAYTVRVDTPNPIFARMLQQAIGGPEGRDARHEPVPLPGLGSTRPKKYRDMLIHTGTEDRRAAARLRGGTESGFASVASDTQSRRKIR